MVLPGLAAVLLLGGGEDRPAAPRRADPSPPLPGPDDSRLSEREFVLSAADVSGLYPGESRYLPVRVGNPYQVDISVLRLWAEVVSTSDRRCRPVSSNLEVGQYQPVAGLPALVPAGASRELGGVTVRMPHGVSDDCQRVTFTVRLSGTAKRVSR